MWRFYEVITLVVSSIAQRHNSHALAFAVLEVFVITSAVIRMWIFNLGNSLTKDGLYSQDMAYTLGLVTIAALTVPAFDGDVWLRDIDSSPSPFPLAIIFAYAFPCIAFRIPSMRSLVPQPVPQEPPPSVCHSACSPDCRHHGHIPDTAHKGGSVDPDVTSPPRLHIQNGEAKRAPPILPHTLIRIPNAAEQRASIYLSLPIGSYQWQNECICTYNCFRIRWSLFGPFAEIIVSNIEISRLRDTLTRIITLWPSALEARFA